jgi:hypothetical protein
VQRERSSIRKAQCEFNERVHSGYVDVTSTVDPQSRVERGMKVPRGMEVSGGSMLCYENTSACRGGVVSVLYCHLWRNKCIVEGHGPIDVRVPRFDHHVKAIASTMAQHVKPDACSAVQMSERQ